jgi:hypothetical protein
MTDSLPLNGDEKKRPQTNRISSPDKRRPPPTKNPESEREGRIIDALKKRYDEIEALWSQAEEDLKRFRVPSGVEHCYASDYEGSYPIHYVMWWVRHGKSWRICHEIRKAYSEFDDKQHDESDWKPIIECPLDLRLRMIPEFEHLRRKVIEEAENAVPQLDNAITSFRKILNG